MHRKKVSLLALVFATLLSFASGLAIPYVLPRETSGKTVIVGKTIQLTEGEYLVTRVLDGDTIEIEGGYRVRYEGIDAPELADRYGTQAYEANKDLVDGKKVRLEFTESEPDLYGRVLAYIWKDNLFVNERLVADGLAQVLWYNKMAKPKYYERLKRAEDAAKQDHWGMWLETE
jgi:micrococcal nuclease